MLCHNHCCLIQSMCELGIESKFWGEAGTGREEQNLPMMDATPVEAWECL